MNHCSVISCLNKRNDLNYKFFQFPSDLDLCKQWVDFCHCPEVSERFSTGGPYGLRRFAICSEHFDASVLGAVDMIRKLPKNAVPSKIGKTYMSEEMLLETGFSLDNKVENTSHSIDHVLVEMLSSGEMDNESEQDLSIEFVGDKCLKVEKYSLMEDKIKHAPADVKQRTSIKREDVGDNTSNQNLNNETINKQQSCADCCHFKARFDYEVRKNEGREELIAQNKQRIADYTTKVQKLHDRLTRKQSKRDQLKKKFYELRIRCRKGITAEGNIDTIEENYDDGDIEAWW